jgi:hypothetical protein
MVSSLGATMRLRFWSSLSCFSFFIANGAKVSVSGVKLVSSKFSIKRPCTEGRFFFCLIRAYKALHSMIQAVSRTKFPPYDQLTLVYKEAN